MQETCIAGAGMTAFGRFLDRPLGALAAEAAREALADAEAEPAEVQAIVFANATQGALEGQHGIRGQAALDGLGFGNAPVFNVENACASASTALNLAHTLVGSGAYDCALAIGAEKMVMADPARSMAAFEGSWDLSRREQTIADLACDGARRRRSSRRGRGGGAQRLHGCLRRLLPASHGEVRNDPAADGGGQRQEPSPFRRERPRPIQAAFHD